MLIRMNGADEVAMVSGVDVASQQARSAYTKEAGKERQYSQISRGFSTVEGSVDRARTSKT